MTGDDLVARVLERLSSSGAEHTVLHHAPVLTSEDASRVRGTRLEDGAKALVCRADGRSILIVIPASARLDTKGFKRAHGIKDLRMASNEDLERLGTVSGGVPPFGSLIGSQTYADEALGERDKLSFNIGHRTTSVIMSAAEYLRLERPILGRFAVEAASPER